MINFDDLVIDDDFDEELYEKIVPSVVGYYGDTIPKKKRYYHHYLNYGKDYYDTNKDKLPEDFDWEDYLSLNQDLIDSGIITEQKASDHFLYTGRKENRAFKKPVLQKISKFKDNLYKITKDYKISISVLLFYPEADSIQFIENTCSKICSYLFDIGFSCVNLHIRNNSLDYNQEKIRSVCDKIKSASLKVYLYDNHNMGYGEGHNANFSSQESDFFLCLNDDIEIEDFEWISESMDLFESNSNLAIIGSLESPQYVNDFGCGNDIGKSYKKEPDYSEGSIFFVRSSVFEKLKGFDKIFKYFYFEDVDLCLRAKQIGFDIENIQINNVHRRSTSAKKIPSEVRSSIIELNRSRFLCRWKKHLSSNQKKFSNKVLININCDGIGDIVDSFYPVACCIKQHELNDIDISIPKKMHFLYKFFSRANLIKEHEADQYDTIYNINQLNYSYPMHTMDLIASKLNVINLDTDEKNIKAFVSKKFANINEKYVVLHLDSQRSGFEGRMPDPLKLIDLIKYFSSEYKIVLIGQTFKKLHCFEYENVVQSLKDSNILYDHRNGSIEEMFGLINDAFLFVGVDSGPSHMAQLFNVPSYIIYGPINPMTKIHRYHNSGCWYNLTQGSGGGDYHLNLSPCYNYDIRRDFECININPKELVDSIDKFIQSGFQFNWIPVFENLRIYHRNILNLQFSNPVFYNPILEGLGTSIENRTNMIINNLLSYEKYAAEMIKSTI
jgi:hypothetical protein